MANVSAASKSARAPRRVALACLCVLFGIACGSGEDPEVPAIGQSGPEAPAGGAKLPTAPQWTLADIVAAKDAGDAGALARALESEELPTPLRVLAAMGLEQIGSGAPECLSALLEGTQAEAPELRSASAFALWRVGGDAKTAVPVLLEVLEVADPPRQKSALYRLGLMGDAARKAMRAVRTIATDRDAGADTRAWAADALWRIGGEPEAVSILIELLAAPEGRAVAASALGSIGLPHAARAVDRLKAALGEELSPEARTRIAGALGLLGEPAAAVRELMSVLAGEEASVEARRGALMSLAEFRADAEPALPLLDRIASSSDPGGLAPFAAHVAITIRSRLGPGGKND